MKRLILLSLLLLIALCPVVYTQEIGGISSILSPVKFGGKKLPSWLTSEYAPIFNGVNQYAFASSITGMPVGSAPRTIIAWVKPNTVGGALLNISMGSQGGGTHRSQNMLPFSSTLYEANFYNAGLRYSYPGIGVWAHHAHVYPGGAIASTIVYLNGNPVTTTLISLTASEAGLVGQQIYLGTGNTGTGYSACNLAEVALFNRALTQSEIQRYYTKRLKGTETGLVALYHMNDNAQTLVDSVGGKNAVASNSVAWTKRNGYAAPDVRSERYALSFDGVDDYISAASAAMNILPQSSFTISIWAQPRAGTDDGIVTKGYAGSSGQSMGLYAFFGATYKGFYGYSITGSNVVPSYDLNPYAKWQHVVLTRPEGAGATGSIYLNGVLVSSNTADISAGYASAAVPLFIGVAPNGATPFANTYYNGKLCEVSVWNRYFTPAQIQAQYFTDLTGTEPYLNSYFPLDEGTGTTVDNKVSGGPDGSFGGAPTWVGRDIP